MKKFNVYEIDFYQKKQMEHEPVQTLVASFCKHEDAIWFVESFRKLDKNENFAYRIVEVSEIGNTTIREFWVTYRAEIGAIRKKALERDREILNRRKEVKGY